MKAEQKNHDAAVVAETPQLQLRRPTLQDASFFVRLLNEFAWIDNIGDRGVRSDSDAESYIQSNLNAHFHAHGYGMFVIELKSTRCPIGLCGLVKRDFLLMPDLGFALLTMYAGRGYASEAASAVIECAAKAWGIKQLYAIVKRNNLRSIRLLERLGFRNLGQYLTPQGVDVELYSNG